MELLKTLFEKAELPADFKEQAEVLFEASVNEVVEAKVAAKAKELSEAFDAKLADAINEQTEKHVENLSKFLDEAVLEWAKENAVAIDGKLQLESAQLFLSGIKSIFEKAEVEINGDTEGVVKALQEQVEELKAKNESQEKELTEAQTQLIANEKANIIAEATDELADTQADRVAKLCESFDFKSSEDFKKKVELVVEAVSGKKKVKEDAADGDDEDKDPDADGDDDSTKDKKKNPDADQDDSEDDDDELDESKKKKVKEGYKAVKVSGDLEVAAADAHIVESHEEVETIEKIVERTKEQHAPHFQSDLVKATFDIL